MLELTDLDHGIWRDELDAFVPRNVFDIHTHVYAFRFAKPSAATQKWFTENVGEKFAVADWAAVNAADKILMPDRKVHRLSFGFPFPQPNDFSAANEFVRTEVSADDQSAGLMLVHPGMAADEIESQVLRDGFLGFKPYRVYATNGDPARCHITEFLPESQIAIADKYGLMIMLHLSMPNGIADETNQRDLLDLSEKYHNARWILAHCARSYFAQPIKAAASVLKRLHNTWYDTSSVCDSGAIAALIDTVGVDRVMYGSDDLPVGASRGKYITFGNAWSYLSDKNHDMSLVHCDGRMTYVRYEQLRAMKTASEWLRLSEADLASLFHNTASQLVSSARSGAKIALAASK